MNADLLAQINRVNCGAKGVLGTGTNNCPFNRKRVVAVIFFKSGYEFEEEWSLSYLHELQQRGLALVLSKAVDFTDVTAEDSINTYDSSRVKTINGKSPYEYQITFNNGIYFHKALASLESFGNYDVAYIDEDLNILFTATDTAAKGFTCGQIGVMPYQGANGNGPATNRIWWQELYRSEFDKDAAWVTGDNHNIRLAQLDGVNDATIEFAVIPTDGATSVQFRVKTKADKKDIDLGGLLPANIQLTNGSSIVNISSPISFDVTTGIYTATFSSPLLTGNVLKLRLNDSNYSTGIILKGGRLYRSNVAEQVVLGN